MMTDSHTKNGRESANLAPLTYFSASLMMTDYVIESLPRLRSSQQDCSGGYGAVIIRLALRLLLKHM